MTLLASPGVPQRSVEGIVADFFEGSAIKVVVLSWILQEGLQIGCRSCLPGEDLPNFMRMHS